MRNAPEYTGAFFLTRCSLSPSVHLTLSKKVKTFHHMSGTMLHSGMTCPPQL